MEKYNLEQTGQQVQKILNEATPQSELTAETERAQLAEQQLQNDIDAIEEKIPSDASSSNKLATEEYVDDSVSTATATFRGTFNLVSDLGLTVDATEQQIAAALASEISTADNNDYCFVQIPTSAETPTEIEEIDRYKFNGTAWSFEYELNNSGFTADQWDAINSHVTSGDVAKLLALPTNAELTILLNGKQDVLTFDNVPTENSNNPVKSGGVKSAIDDEKGARLNGDAALQQSIDGINGKIPSDASSENKLATASDVDDEATARSNADQSLQDAIEAILLLIPTAASSLNQLADKAFVNSSIATNTATFRGTFNLVNDLHLTLAATHSQIGNALALAIQESDNNDYAFVQIPTVETAPNEIAQTDRYKFNGSTWEYEYTLNNSGFTSAQWITINSGITSVLVSKLSELPTNSELTSEFGALTTAINNINLKIPAAAAQNNKLVDTAALEAYIIQVLNVLTVTYNVTSSDGHVTFHIEQTDGKITAVTLTTNDIASANDLTVLAGRVTTAENDIDSLEFRVGTNEADIVLLQAAYAGLTQSDIIIGALPASGVANKIYRVPGTSSYSDYMWNGTQFVLMATYNNAIDPRPKKASQNLVTSGGIFDNMGALDISELNATENPHTLATYADLSAALAAIPSNDYKKGGMSIKFVQTDDNKYVQYRLMADSFNTTPANWQGVDDEPTAGSDNLVKSGGVEEPIRELKNKTIRLSENIIYGTGVVRRDGTIVDNTHQPNWYRSSLIKINDVQSDSIQLSVSSNGDSGQANAAGYVAFDENMVMVKKSDNGVQVVEKTTLPNNAVYIMFSFYDKTIVTIKDYTINDCLEDLRIQEARLKNNIIYRKGVVSRDGDVIDDYYGSPNWYRTDYIKIDDVLSDIIKLSVSSNGNSANPNAAGYVAFDNNKVMVQKSDGGVQTINKSSLPNTAIYIMFSFYDNAIVTIENYHISDLIQSKADKDSVLVKTQQVLSNDEREDVLKNLKVGAGILSSNIIDGNGCVTPTGELITLAASTQWFKSVYVDVDKIFSDTITLSNGCNSNGSNPSAAPYAFFDKNKNFISAGQYGTSSLNKADLPTNCKYIVFSFYSNAKKITTIDGYNVREGLDKLKEIVDNVYLPKDRISLEDKGQLQSLSIVLNGKRPFNFIHLSDTHTKAGNTKCVENAMSLLQESFIDCAVISGDIIWDNFPDSITPFNDAINGNTKDLIMCVGNHDVGESRNVADCGSDLEVYNKFYAPYIKNNFVLGGENKNYFYVDYPDYKIRFISIYQFNCDMALDPEDETKLKWRRASAAYRQDEINWLISTLNSTPEGYVVFPITHYTGLMGDKFNDWQSIELANTGNNELLGAIFKAFKNRSAASYTINQTYNVVTELQITYDFTNTVADFGAWICGHTHDDFIGKDSTGKIWIMDKCADNLLYQYGTTISRVADTYNENAINVVSVDTVRKTISVYRVGGKYSRNGDYRNVITIDYSS